MARAWGCTPAQLRDCSLAEYAAMLRVLTDEAQRTRGRGGR